MASLADSYFIVALAEKVPSIVTGGIQHHIGHRMVGLLVVVQVDEVDQRTLGAVAAVECHGDVHVAIDKCHLSVDGIGPHND